MLYDHKWDREPSLDGFISWLGKQDPEEEYIYSSCMVCPIAQYAHAIGSTYTAVTRGPGVQWNMMITAQSPQTFGGAHKRAIAYRELCE